jgi:hypothetical protein
MPPTNRAAPATGAAQSLTAAKPLDCPQSSWPRRWAQIRERRRAARDLDRMLGCDPYPDVAAVYGLDPHEVRKPRAAARPRSEAS